MQLRSIPICVTLAWLAATAAAEESADAFLEARDSKSPPRMPQLEIPVLWKAVPADAREAFDVTEAARYGEAKVGDRTIRLLFLERQGTGVPGLLHSDRGTGAFDRNGDPVRGNANSSQKKLAITFDDVDGGGFKHKVQIVFVPDRVAARIVIDRHRFARVKIGNAERGLFLFDADGDGAFNGERDRWVLIRMDRNRRITGTRLWSDTFLLREPYIPFRVDGTTYMIEDVAADGSRARVRIGVPKMPMSAVLERRYAEVEARYKEIFDREEENFLARWKFDPARDMLSESRPWDSKMTLDEAQKKAKELGKPLLVHYYTEGTIWSYRYERYTFRDKAADRRTARQVPAREDRRRQGPRAQLRNRRRRPLARDRAADAGGPDGAFPALRPQRKGRDRGVGVGDRHRRLAAPAGVREEPEARDGRVGVRTGAACGRRAGGNISPIGR